MMGGEISVHSEVGVGSTFKFQIAYTPVSEKDIVVDKPEQVAVALEPGQPQKRILIAEDRDENRRLLVELLKHFGFEIREALNGLEAIDLWRTWHPDLIWMDIQMPVLDGFQAIRHIKSRPEGKDTVVIAITASAFEEDRERILDEGADDFVRKPFRDTLIFEKLTEHLAVRFIYQDTVAGEGSEKSANLAIAVSPESLNQIPDKLLSDLYEAAIQADLFQVEAIIEEIRKSNPSCADMFANYADNFQYNKITEIIDQAGEIR
jgi:CheY-like chemotaxis protein